MSKVLVPQMAERHLALTAATKTSISSQAEGITTTTEAKSNSKTFRMSSLSSHATKNSRKEQQQLKPSPNSTYNYKICSNGSIKSATTPIDTIGQQHQQRHYSSSDSIFTNSVPPSPTQLLDFDDINSTSSIMEFLRQEQQCATGGAVTPNGLDSEIDAESIFQEVSRLTDNSDTRSVDELLREAELLLKHQQFMGTMQEQTRASSKKTKTDLLQSLQYPSQAVAAAAAPPQHAHPPTTSIRMNSKYTKRIENVNHRDTLNKLMNGYGANIISLEDCTPPLMTPETPTVTQSLSEAGSGGGISCGACTFNNFANNMTTASVISEESAPGDFPDDSTTATITQCSSNDDNTTGKDVTTKQIDGEDTDDGTDTIEEITEAMETIELNIATEVHHGDGTHNDDVAANCKAFSASPTHPLNASNENVVAVNTNDSLNLTNSTFSSISSTISTRTSTDNNRSGQRQSQRNEQSLYDLTHVRRPSCDNFDNTTASQHKQTFSSPNLLASPMHRWTAATTSSNTNTNTERCNSGSYLGRRSSMTTPDSGISSQTYLTGSDNAAVPLSQRSSSPNVKSIGIVTTTRTYCDKSVNSSPIRMVSTLTSPMSEQLPPLVNSSSNHSIVSLSREHVLKQEIEQLQERLKDTEERLESFRLQHDTVSQLHRKLRESNTQLQDDSEMLKLDVQHLNECANVLRSELQAARNDRDEALDLQKVLQNELEETRAEKKRACEQKEKDAKHIQDLQRQCREMERILMRKHPDSVSALIVASKSSNISGKDQDNASSRKLLEQRIAQLEADAKEQDYKAQQILANVQARFNSVQSKYETHIADLETQVLSLQEINTKLNEKIESQVRTLDYFVSKKAEKFYNNCTQTEEPYVLAFTHTTPPPPPAAVTAPKTRKICRKTISTQTTLFTRESGTNTIGTSSQHSASSSTSSTANSTPNNSRPNSKQSGIRRPMVSVAGNHLSSAIASKLPISQSDSTISLSAAQAVLNAKEDAHLVATIRGMRVDLAIKNKALQRLTRELDECKKTIKKLQKEKDAFKYQCTAASTSSTTSRLNMDHMPATTETQALKEAQSKCKLLEADYKSLHDKRLQDLKTLQTAHERELATCHETVRILQQRLNERDEQFAMQKRRKVPVDYYALKAKVSSLERRHTEREERLHMLVEALSKGRLNGALDDLLGDNNNQ